MGSQCAPVTKYRTEQEKYTQCSEVPYQHCDRVKDTNCRNVPQQKCNDVPYQDCQNIQRERCVPESYQECDDVPEQKCRDEHKKTPRQVAKQIPIRVAATIVPLIMKMKKILAIPSFLISEPLIVTIPK